MTLSVETGAGLADAESYVSVTDADSYHAARANTGWDGDVAAKEAALRRATEYLDGLYRTRWLGQAATAGQALAWPRAYVVVDRAYLPSDDLPPALVRACCEVALRELQAPNSLVPDIVPGERIVSEKVGPLSTTYAAGPASDALPVLATVERLIAPLLRSVAAALVLRA